MIELRVDGQNAEIRCDQAPSLKSWRRVLSVSGMLRQQLSRVQPVTLRSGKSVCAIFGDDKAPQVMCPLCAPFLVMGDVVSGLSHNGHITGGGIH